MGLLTVVSLPFTGIDLEDLREAIFSSSDDEVVGHWVQQNAQDRSQEEIRAWSDAIITSLSVPTPERIAKRTLFYPGPAKVFDLSSMGPVNPCDLIDFDEGRISLEDLLGIVRNISAWNSKNPEKVSMVYTIDSQWRNRSEFLHVRSKSSSFS